MRTITITTQEYLSLGLVNTLSYQIMPFDEVNFPFNYILYYNDLIVEASVGYMTSEELDDWSVYQTMDEKIKAKLDLI